MTHPRRKEHQQITPEADVYTRLLKKMEIQPTKRTHTHTDTHTFSWQFQSRWNPWPFMAISIKTKSLKFLLHDNFKNGISERNTHTSLHGDLKHGIPQRKTHTLQSSWWFQKWNPWVKEQKHKNLQNYDWYDIMTINRARMNNLHPWHLKGNCGLYACRSH